MEENMIVEKIINDYIEGQIQDLNTELFKCVIAEMAEDCMALNESEIRFYLDNNIEFPHTYKNVKEVLDVADTMTDILGVGTKCKDIGSEIKDLKKYDINSFNYKAGVINITNNFLEILETATDYIPIIGGLVSAQMSIASSIFEIGSKLVLDYVKRLNDAIAEIEAAINGTTVEEEKLKMYIEGLNPNSKEYKKAMDQYNEMKSVMKTVQDFLAVFSTDAEEQALSNKININPIIIDLNKNKKYAGSLEEGTYFDSENKKSIQTITYEVFTAA